LEDSEALTFMSLRLPRSGIDEEALAYFKRWFAHYVSTYYTDDSLGNYIMKLKEEHTQRVCREIVTISRALDLSAEDLLLGETMALFHDLGRFPQYATYRTFQDSASENHAQLGLKELARHQVLSICSETAQLLIAKAIGYHNVRSLPKGEDQRLLFFARLLRDADKLDIWRVFVDYYNHWDEQVDSTIVWNLPNHEACSPKILDAIRHQKMADTSNMSSLNDFKLLQISWVFDVNFQPTFRAVCEHRYLERIAVSLPTTKEIKEVVSIAEAYTKSQLAV
jgi:hypothetical protein